MDTRLMEKRLKSEIEDFEEIEIDMIDFYIETELFPPSEEEIQADLEEVQEELREEKEDELDKEIPRDDTNRKDELPDEEILLSQYKKMSKKK